jgi:predicted DNA-binding protein
MVRKQVYITRQQQERLSRLAKVRGCTEAEIIRQGVDEALHQEEKLSPAGSALWAREMTFYREVTKRAQLLQEQGLTSERDWTRDELYDRPKYLYEQRPD